MMFSLIIFLRS